MIKRLNARIFKNILNHKSPIQSQKHIAVINNNIYCSFSKNNFNFNHNYNNHNFNIKYYTTINNNRNNININNNGNISKEENNKEENNKEDSNKEDNNSSTNKEDKDYYNSFKNDNANNEFKEKIENERLKDKNSFDGRAIGMLIIKISLINYLIRYYVLDFTYCQGSSMQPTISSGAILLINRLTTDYKVNDLITAISPTTGDYNICKRIKFVEGDTILFHSETGSVIYTIPKGYVWIEGDNPSTSKDSRSYGPIPKRLLTGKVILRLNPLSLLREEPPETETQKLN